MPEQIIRIWTPIKAKWDGLTVRQRIQLAGATALLILALILFLFFTFRTRWVAMYEGQTAHRLMQVSAELDRAGIRNNMSADGRSLYVPQRDRIRANGIIIASDNQTIAQMPIANALDLIGLGTTDAERQTVLRQNAQSDIRDMMLVNPDIWDAAVSITYADRGLLLRPGQPAAALSVVLSTRRRFSPSEGRVMAEILRNSVSGLELDNISITDQDFNPIFVGGMTPESDTAMDIWNLRLQQENTMVANLTRSFTPIFDEVAISPHIVYEDHIGMAEIIRVFRAAPGTDGLVSQYNFTRQQMEGWMGGAFAPGVGANNLVPPAYMMGDPGVASAQSHERMAQMLYDEHETVIDRGPGGMDAARSSISVIGTLDTIIYEGDWFERRPEATRADWLEYQDNTPRWVYITEGVEVEVMRQATAMATGIPLENVWTAIQERFIFVDSEETPLPIATIIMLIVLGLLLLMLLLLVLLRKKEEEEEIEPELSVEDLLATTQLEEAKDEAERLKDIEFEEGNEVKRQIDKFVTERPEAVAVLLRNWLNAEEW